MAHENVEVRLFNPFVLRRPKLANYLFDVVRLNRRMHNKSFTVDGAASIVGGRNVGDEYFGAGTTGDYFDLDVMAVGGIVPEVARQFDRYWASEPVYPAQAIIGKDDPGGLDRSIEAAKRDPRAEHYVGAVRDTQLVAAMLDHSLELESVDAVVVADDPSKGTGPITGNGLLMRQLEAQLGQVERRLDLVSAYFVPGEKGTDMLAGLARRGVRVQVLTNGLEATDVLPVHAGYAKYRKALLRSGVRLSELKRGRADSKADDLGITGSSAASLHAKTFGVDSARIFIGSFNFDPRSLLLNTEMGLLIDSVAQATALERRFGQNVRTGAYEVELAPGGDLAWVETAPDGKTTRLASEPGSSWARRLAVTVIGWLPVEWLL